jgi:hypothetical protein
MCGKCPMCLGGMPAFCQGISLESNQASPEIESVHSPINDPREDGELNGNEDNSEEEEEFRGSRNSRKGVRSGRGKRIAALGDQQSSGRKMAHKLFPLHKGEACEWQGSANCGGGEVPILGCLRGTQQAAHHGPDKNTSNNEVGNVHRICHPCHYRWHGKNDTNYDWNATVYPAHEPREMTPEEKELALMADLKYASGKMSKVED